MGSKKAKAKREKREKKAMKKAKTAAPMRSRDLGAAVLSPYAVKENGPEIEADRARAINREPLMQPPVAMPVSISGVAPAAEAAPPQANGAVPTADASPSPPAPPPAHPAVESAPPIQAEAPPRTTPEVKPAALDYDRLAINTARFIEQGGKALAAYFKPFETGGGKTGLGEEITDAVHSIGKVAEHWIADPTRALEAQRNLSTHFLELWSSTFRRLSGEKIDPLVPYDPTDKRYAAPEWRDSPIFDFLRQAHSIATAWADDLARRSDELDPHTRSKARFYLRQISSALSPANFLATNPELLRETIASSGENLARGAALFAEDIEAGKGTLRIRQTDRSKFELGVNMAVTPGKVVFRNDLIELIQYAPTTETVFKRPLLIVPPWINKFYILDLNPEKSFVQWAVAQGLTVFMISWVNPDARQRDKSFEDYIREGIFAALDAIKDATGEEHASAIGYCVGGTLLSVALALMAQENDGRIESATLFAAQTDFSEAGELRVFIDEEQISTLEAKMAEKGYLEGSQMANAFNMLRPNDLIWSYFVNNYMKGKTPMPFDLLTWNADATRMPAANHSFYLRNCYLENKLAKAEMVIAGKTLDLGKVTIPIYNLATREDHIAPAQSVFKGAKLFGGEMRYVLSGSGHIAGVINPPAKPKYQYWTGPRPSGTFEDWQKLAVEHKGSWWPDWIQWIAEQAPDKVPARTPGDGKLSPICDAPGEYVRIQA